MDSTDTEEAIIVETKRIFCDGASSADSPLGHPGVYLNIEDDGQVVCPYCSRTYQLAEGASVASGH